MAKETVEKYFSDISGREISGDNPTVVFSLGGVHYEIDVTDDERAALRDALAPYIEAARPASPEASRKPGPNPATVRAWAVEQGITVPKRGRVPGSVIDAFNAAH